MTTLLHTDLGNQFSQQPLGSDLDPGRGGGHGRNSQDTVQERLLDAEIGESGRNGDGLAVWRLSVHGADVPGRFVIVDREFKPFEP
jgi:hypothetical protein